ncbi:MAG: hypothetical protein QNJ29_04205 [Rhizobiaceae bacterium]|nr:hypothetical protein [Rhizobiaceae bacterium]
MQTSELLNLQQVVTRCETLIESLGVCLQSGTDFEVFNYLASDSDREQPLDPIFRSVESDIDMVDGLWLIGRDANREIVQTQAMRSIELGEGNLAAFMQYRINELRPGGQQVDLYNTSWRLSASAQTICGNVFYHGGLWIRKDFRGGSLTCLFTRYLIAKTLLQFEPDYLIGLQSPFVSCRGLSAREGYMHLEQRCIRWKFHDAEELFEDWLVWMSKEEAEFNLAIPPEDFYTLFEKQVQPALKTA